MTVRADSPRTRLRKALADLVAASPGHDSWCAYPDGPCGGMGSDECSMQRTHRLAVQAAVNILKEIPE
jgi:hypothetical protein